MTREDRAAELKAEWRAICRSMNGGLWRGTEDQAVARIDEIKAEIAKMEADE